MAKTIMIQGTMSSVGKSLITTGLCRIFRQDGYSVAPFKSQNLSSNSFLTSGGFEMSRAQAIQAEAAGIDPSALMNPILLKPSNEAGAEVIVNGISRGIMNSVDYQRNKETLAQDIMFAFDTLSEQYDIIVIEGAGSPAEINLKQKDIVNMGLAKMTNSPVILVGDIDRGGVFAQIVGTLMLLEDDERERVKGTVINKFRGDIELLRTGITMLEERSGKPVAGVLPYIDVDIEEEDSLTDESRIKQQDSVAENTIYWRLEQYDILASAMRDNLDLKFIYGLLEHRQ